MIDGLFGFALDALDELVARRDVVDESDNLARSPDLRIRVISKALEINQKEMY